MTSPVADIAPSSLGEEDLIAALANCERARHRIYAAQLRIIAEVDGRGIATERGCGEVAALVRQVLHVNPGEARRRVAHARALVASFAPTGAALDPELPRL
ncbi:MAG: DUF222 domain-containing protein, partial [Haloechinothrix sp.]